jgi:hypothetical protein
LVAEARSIVVVDLEPSIATDAMAENLAGIQQTESSAMVASLPAAEGRRRERVRLRGQGPGRGTPGFGRG